MNQKIATIIYSAFIYCISATLVFAQSAALLPNAQQVYLDNNGNPLATGTVGFYYPSTLNLKPIWQDANESVVYTNPVTLNSAGRPPGSQGIYGQGAYRQIVKDVNGNTIWDALTSSAGSSSGTAATGDGDLVGTIKPWAGITAPNQYQFAYGQQLNRTTFAALFTAITQSLAVTCTSASNTLSGIADTTSINVGSPLEAAACVVPGTTVSSKTSSTVVMSNPSSVNLNTTAVFFPFGNGDGSTTFTLPDFRGNTIAGRQNMGGTASTNLTNCNAGQGTTCGNQNTTLARANLPNVAPTATSIFTGTPVTPSVSSTGTFLVSTGGTGTSVLTGGGGAINQATLAFNAITPAGTIATTVQSLNGGVTQTAFSTIQPTITLNYIIKVTADTNSAIATGVTDINGMVGSIACGAGLNCTGNVISTLTAATCAVNGAFIIYNSSSGISVCSTTAGLGTSGVINGPFIINPPSGITSGLSINQTLTGAAGATNWNSITIASDNVAGGFLADMNVTHSFGGPAATGARVGQFNWLIQTAATSASNTSRNYLAAECLSQTNSGDGGSGTGEATAKGAYFGCNSLVRNAGTNVYNMFAHEFDLQSAAATSARYSAAGAFVNFEAVQGTAVDAGVLFYSGGTVAAAGGGGPYGPGVGFHCMICAAELASNGLVPVDSTGTVFGTFLSSLSNIPVLTVFDVRGYSPSAYILQATNATISGSGQTDINRNASPASVTALGSATALRLAGADTTSTAFVIDAFGGAPSIISRRTAGTAASRSGVGNNDVLALFTGEGWTSSAAYTGQVGSIQVVATETFTNAAQGTKITFSTTPATTTTTAVAMTLQASGCLSVGTTTDCAIGSIIANKFIQSGTTVVASLPTCNAGTQGARYFVTDQATAVAYHGAVTGSGAFKQGVICDGTNWYQA